MSFCEVSTLRHPSSATVCQEEWSSPPGPPGRLTAWSPRGPPGQLDGSADPAPPPPPVWKQTANPAPPQVCVPPAERSSSAQPQKPPVPMSGPVQIDGLLQLNDSPTCHMS